MREVGWSWGGLRRDPKPARSRGHQGHSTPCLAASLEPVTRVGGAPHGPRLLRPGGSLPCRSHSGRRLRVNPGETEGPPEPHPVCSWLCCEAQDQLGGWETLSRIRKVARHACPFPRAGEAASRGAGWPLPWVACWRGSVGLALAESWGPHEPPRQLGWRAGSSQNHTEATCSVRPAVGACAAGLFAVLSNVCCLTSP